MPFLNKIKNEINEFSGWFKIALVALFVIYVSFWIFTISLHNIQKAKGAELVLPVIAGDSQEYEILAESILAGNGFTMDSKIETLRTPGYPAFVAIIETLGRTYFLVTLLQIFIVFISAWIIRKIGIFFISKRVGEIAAFLFLFNPVTLVLSLLILSDTLFLLLFALGFYLAVTMDNDKIIRKIALIAAIFSFAVYVRPIGFFAFPIFIAPVLVSKIDFKIRWKLAVLMTFFMVILISPWILRNYVKTGVASFSNIADFNLTWVATRFLALKNGTSLESETAAFAKASGVPDSWRDIHNAKALRVTAEKIILSNPISYAKYHIVSSLPFLFPSTVAFALDTYNSLLGNGSESGLGSINSLVSGNPSSFLSGVTKLWWKVLERLGWLLINMVSFWGIWKYRKNPLTWAFVLIIAYLMLLSGPASGPRYSFQAWPYIFILFAGGAVSLFEKLKSP